MINFSNIDKVFSHAEKKKRSYLLEHEVYQILKECGLNVPRFLFLEKNRKAAEKDLLPFKGNIVVVKVVAPIIVHKTDVGGIRFVSSDADAVNKACRNMLENIPRKYRDWAGRFQRHESKKVPSLARIEKEIEGFLICESVEYDKTGFGTELLLGIRNSRDFGPVVTMGVGGIEIEYLSERIKEGKALSIGSPHILLKKDILRILEPLAVYDKLVGKVRGKEALTTKEAKFAGIMGRLNRSICFAI